VGCFERGGEKGRANFHVLGGEKGNEPDSKEPGKEFRAQGWALFEHRTSLVVREVFETGTSIRPGENEAWG